MEDAPSFTCPRCGRTSHNPNDVRERYCGNCHLFTDDILTFWVITRRPSDLPHCEYVLRGQDLLFSGPRTLAWHSAYKSADTLEEVRKFLPPGAVNLNRTPGDDPVIVEVWI